MDFLHLISVARKQWLIVAAGVLVGFALVFGSVYDVGRFRETGELEKRSYTSYTVETQVLVTDPDFWMGRAGPADPQQPDIFPKTVTLATTYSGLLSSDAVRQAAEAKVGPTDAEIVSEALPNAPIIKVTITGTDREQLVRFGIALEEALEEYLAAEQEESGIPESARMTVRPLAKPKAKAVQSRQLETAVLAFSVPVFVAFGLAIVRDRTQQNDWGKRMEQTKNRTR